MTTKTFSKGSQTALVLITILAIVLTSTLVFVPGSQASAQTTTAKLTIQNKTKAPVVFQMKGPKNVYINLPAGKTVLDLPFGKYTFQYKACGIEIKGSLEVKKTTKPIQIAACKTAKILMINYTSQTASFQFAGPENKTIQVLPNTQTRIDIWQGTYKVTFRYCGEVETDTVKLTGRWRMWVRGC
jgi:hypothetical protein